MCYQKAMVMDCHNLDLWEATGEVQLAILPLRRETCSYRAYHAYV